MSRPETTAPPELFYNESEARKYDSSSRMIKIQEQITTRAMEMLGLPNRPCYILDIGCGSGLSGQVLEEAGHYWVGCDISSSMLSVATEQDSDTGDLCHVDMGQGLPFRPATFDGIISISAIQWLCYSNAAAQTTQCDGAVQAAASNVKYAGQLAGDTTYCSSSVVPKTYTEHY